MRQKTQNFALGPQQRVTVKFFQKSETANRKTIKRWSRNSTFSFRYVTAEKIYNRAQNTEIRQIFIFTPFSLARCQATKTFRTKSYGASS